MEKHNILIRTACEKHGCPLWFLGDMLGISEASVTRMMRRELPKEEQKRIVQLIETHARKE